MALYAKRTANDSGGFRDINVTPFVDVLLVLLLVFMVSAPLMANGLQVELPGVSGENAAIDEAPPVLSISADERILFEEKDVTTSVEQVLRDHERVQSGRALNVMADKRAHYEVVARAMSAARAAGVTSLNLVVDPEPTAL